MKYQLIALCGWPKTGKSTIQKMLQEEYNYSPQDDGRMLRDAAMTLYNLTEWHVSTQEGKASKVSILGEEHTVRYLLGNLGDILEERWGNQFIPEAAIKKFLSTNPTGLASFGSVRKNQGISFKKHGGLVIGIRRDGIESPINQFDHFDESLVDVWIDNPVDANGAHTQENIELFENYARSVLKSVL